MTPVDHPSLKICIDCLIPQPICEFPLREAGKSRTRCSSCFRKYANAKRHKENGINDIADLPVAINLVAGEQESWIDVVIRILVDEKFLVIPDTDFGEEFIDIEALLKTENSIARLVEKEMESEKDSYLPKGFNGRASQGRRRLDQEPN